LIVALERAAVRWMRRLALLGGWTLVAVAVATVVDALLRYLAGRPIPGTFEATELFLAAIIFFGLPYTGLIDGHVSVDALTGRLERRGQHLGQPLADRPPVPGALADELLQRLLVAVRQALGHGLDRLALAVQHQPAQVDLTPAALIGARQRLEHLRGEGDQAPSRLGQLGRGHRVLTSTLSSSTMRRHCRGDSP